MAIDMEEYRRGVAEAVEICGADVNAYTKVSYGLARAMTAAGLPRTWRDLSRWHDPLAGSTDADAIDPWRVPFTGCVSRVGCMEFNARRLAERGSVHSSVESYEVGNLRAGRARDWMIDRVYSYLAAAEDLDGIEKEASGLIDSEIKRAHPKTRRGTKVYRDLADSVRDKARGIVRAQRAEAVKRALSEAEAWLVEESCSEYKQGHAKDRNAILGHVNYLRLVADDIACILPDSEVPAMLRSRAGDVEALWVTRDATVQGHMRECRERLAVLLVK